MSIVVVQERLLRLERQKLLPILQHLVDRGKHERVVLRMLV